MQIITKGYVWVSCVLVIVGLILARLLWPILDNPVHILKKYEYGELLLLLGIGIPIAIINNLESKYIWGRIFRNTKIDLLGVSIGFMVGLIIGYIGPPV